jgi:hypothetical protein
MEGKNPDPFNSLGPFFVGFDPPFGNPNAEPACFAATLYKNVISKIAGVTSEEMNTERVKSAET